MKHLKISLKLTALSKCLMVLAMMSSFAACSDNDEPDNHPEEPKEQNPEIEGFGRIADAVDLGLSVKWASWNVGASSIADYGGLYGVGDPTGIMTEQKEELYHYVVGQSICGTEFDLAHVKWGGSWRLPTMAELEELKDRCEWEHNVTIDGVTGSKVKGPNGNELFIPYSGIRNITKVMYRDDHTSLWSGEAVKYSIYNGYKDLDIFKRGYFGTDGSAAWTGQSIRPVCD